ncbi:Prefoldin subunit 6 [Gracilariopsis chorda]|uniref:Prefoldin subunit 6 n=1 Tax=Gracilariopsis chorda TaxID=448386 RepID=A0A2V3J245_9FLOR|nr:Prefoldin subunit 6 [Gracilariopsis chorda]|eukprot:PXF48526.1 Prefoldin subunit 6 [Gracilariopsis chorda]
MKDRIEKMAHEVQNIQKEYAAAMQGMKGLQSQLTENQLVKQELDQLEEGSKVYKLIGPVLTPQDADDAKSTVQTRIDFISKELANARTKLEGLEKTQQTKRVALVTEEKKFQALVQQTAAQKQ